MAQLAYAIEDAELGSVRCDGLVIATPAGSTGYNLANGGPVMAWGVEGFAVSFIAPHSLTARALVVAPNDMLTVHNRGRDVVDVIVDGRPMGELAPGDAVSATFRHDVASLAQCRGLVVLPAAAARSSAACRRSARGFAPRRARDLQRSRPGPSGPRWHRRPACSASFASRTSC